MKRTAESIVSCISSTIKTSVLEALPETMWAEVLVRSLDSARALRLVSKQCERDMNSVLRETFRSLLHNSSEELAEWCGQTCPSVLAWTQPMRHFIEQTMPLTWYVACLDYPKPFTLAYKQTMIDEYKGFGHEVTLLMMGYVYSHQDVQYFALFAHVRHAWKSDMITREDYDFALYLIHRDWIATNKDGEEHWPCVFWTLLALTEMDDGKTPIDETLAQEWIYQVLYDNWHELCLIPYLSEHLFFQYYLLQFPAFNSRLKETTSPWVRHFMARDQMLAPLVKYRQPTLPSATAFLFPHISALANYCLAHAYICDDTRDESEATYVAETLTELRRLGALDPEAKHRTLEDLCLPLNTLDLGSLQALRSYFTEAYPFEPNNMFFKEDFPGFASERQLLDSIEMALGAFEVKGVSAGGSAVKEPVKKKVRRDKK